MNRLARAGVVVILASSLGCGAGNDRRGENNIQADPFRVLETGEAFEMFSLDPAARDTIGGFHGWKILGRTEITDQKTRDDIVIALTDGRQEARKALDCFDPRHGIRITEHSKTIDFVICFRCQQVQVFAGDEELPGFLTSRSPQPLLDRVLSAAGVLLAVNRKG